MGSDLSYVYRLDGEYLVVVPAGRLTTGCLDDALPVIDDALPVIKEVLRDRYGDAAQQEFRSVEYLGRG